MSTTHLHGVGERPAKLAEQIKPGDRLMWNFGTVSTVTAIIKTTKTQIIIEEQYPSGTYQRRMGKSRLVAIAG